ncbi:rhodanese-like domain-containing protein [uncultured Bacteroides sp.]|uniref:rhodanese-like domain-containing protein n=1 Tax=uncultured Bacteroides sp. TaxID=162156 RepID=UPI00260331F4|nr:rhodanese-like domain-containing protein [uncultured Bacteroides sp.]
MIKTLYFMFFVFACLFGLFACSAKAQDKFKNLSSDEFERFIQDEEVQRVDVRTVAEYSDGHIPGSLNINIRDDSFAAVADEVLDKDQPVAVYCKSGRRSRNAARILADKGFKVYNLDKGFDNWKECGKDVEN